MNESEIGEKRACEHIANYSGVLSPLQPSTCHVEHVGWLTGEGRMVSLDEAWPQHWDESWRPLFTEPREVLSGGRP